MHTGTGASFIFPRQYVCRFCNELEMNNDDVRAVYDTNVNNNNDDDDIEYSRATITFHPVNIVVDDMKVDVDSTPPPPAPVPHRKSSTFGPTDAGSPDVQITLKDIRTTLQKTQKLPPTHETSGLSSDKPVSPEPTSPVWIPR